MRLRKYGLGLLAVTFAGLATAQATKVIRTNSIELQEIGSTDQVTIDAPSITGDKVATIPALSADDSFVFAAQSQTLTNKSIDSDNNTITNIVDADIKAAAGIAYSKLDLAASLLNSDIGEDISIANGGTGQSTAVAGFDALAPTTTKGDIIVSDGTNNIRLGVGTDGQVLSASSGQTSGLAWANALTDPMTTRGDIIIRNSSNVIDRLAVGADNRLFRSDGTDPSWGQIDDPSFFTSGAQATDTVPGLISKETSGNTTLTFTGAFASGQSCTIYYAISGEMAVIHFDTVTATAAGSTPGNVLSATLPSVLVPTTDHRDFQSTILRDNGTYSFTSYIGSVTLRSDGTVRIEKLNTSLATSNFTASTSIGFSSFIISYPLN